ncbi:hypothetical protein [Brevundimonas sp. 2YAF1]|uniref:hypothetical protein n=1 Tax=Brevundimonas sp. 2YAF1 TaxID=3233024 RepID=UPI003F8DF1B6
MSGSAHVQQLPPARPRQSTSVPFRDAGQALAFPGGLPNLAPADYRIGDCAPVVTLVDGAPQLVMSPWRPRL